MINGLDVIVTGRFSTEEEAMTASVSIIPTMRPYVVRVKEIVEKVDEWMPWDEFKKSEWIRSIC